MASVQPDESKPELLEKLRHAIAAKSTETELRDGAGTGAIADCSDTEGSVADGSDTDGSVADVETESASADDAVRQAKSLALRQLGIRDHSRHELEQKLIGKEVEPGVARAVLDRLEAVSLIDDAEYAKSYVRAKRENRGLARNALSRELKTRGLSGEHIAAALDQVCDDDEFASARLLVEKKARSSVSLDREKRVRRLVSMLGRKGYPPAMSFTIVNDVLDAERE
ncbi:regulatory protein RecX [Saxibacter everestensis]|uniref:Regulatory protein RecX n=1 Tax=Saxibacter everestensis TaxID=2909229 RepID=A0ABY8QXN3_9MICO|nr:regulatory protein RecX [Brevibacteriaceae bacterium ZFBP1038]